jgi:hypothetical protein
MSIYSNTEVKVIRHVTLAYDPIVVKLRQLYNSLENRYECISLLIAIVKNTVLFKTKLFIYGSEFKSSIMYTMCYNQKVYYETNMLLLT